MVHVPNLRRRSPHADAVGAPRSHDTGSFSSNTNPRPSPSNLNSMDEPPSPSRAQEEEEEEEEDGEEEEEGREGGRRAAEQGGREAPSSSAASADWLRLALGGASSSSAETEPPPGAGTRRALTELQLFVDRPSPSSSSAPAPGMRVVSPPRRQAGVWLTLQAAAVQSQGRQTTGFLPQIPRNYLRIKSERMTIRSLMRYVANKLGLADELEVEITCRDQVLLPSMSLQHVRDNIWYSGDAPPVFPDSPGIDHVMTLQYRRSTSTSGSY